MKQKRRQANHCYFPNIDDPLVLTRQIGFCFSVELEHLLASFRDESRSRPDAHIGELDVFPYAGGTISLTVFHHRIGWSVGDVIYTTDFITLHRRVAVTSPPYRRLNCGENVESSQLRRCSWVVKVAALQLSRQSCGRCSWVVTVAVLQSPSNLSPNAGTPMSLWRHCCAVASQSRRSRVST